LLLGDGRQRYFRSGMYQDRSRRRFSGVCDTFQQDGGFFRLAE